MKENNKIILFLLEIVLLVSLLVYAKSPPASTRTAGGVIRAIAQPLKALTLFDVQFLTDGDRPNSRVNDVIPLSLSESIHTIVIRNYFQALWGQISSPELALDSKSPVRWRQREAEAQQQKQDSGAPAGDYAPPKGPILNPLAQQHDQTLELLQELERKLQAFAFSPAPTGTRVAIDLGHLLLAFRAVGGEYVEQVRGNLSA